MIKINLLAVERAKVKKKAAGFHFGQKVSGQKVTIACTLILLAAGSLIGWRYLALNRESARVDAEIASAQQETGRLRSIIQQVQQFEQRKAQLQQRVALIEQLRREQTGPVHMLDQISRALPPMLWLTELRQTSTPNEVLIDGRATSLTELSDFVSNLEASGFFRRSVEIVNTEAQPLKTPPGELISFSLRAQFMTPGQPAPAEAGKPKPAARGRRAAN
jgi:type IV pilus assembly protein PilN